MIIRRLEVKNFRSLKDISFECEELTTILGRNGCGKSTILKALDVFYNVGYLVTDYDYFGKETKEPISIQVTYGELREEELKEFSSYLSGKELSVTKVINGGVAKYFGVSPQLPEFYDYRKLAALQKRKALADLIASGKYGDLGPAPKSEAEADQLMATFEDNHLAILQPFQREQQFFGPRNVGGGKLDKFTKFVLIPAVRDATSETDKKGIILQLIDVLVARSVNARPDVQKLNAEFEARVRDVYCKENLTELSELAKLITSLLSQYAPGAVLDLDFGDVTPPKITLPTALASLVEDNFKSPIGYTGHGLQRALILALLQQLSLTDLSPAKPAIDEKEKAEGNKENTTSAVPGLILAIEEPELYLHPSRSRFLASVLDRLTKKPDDSTEPRTQVMYGTHSPYFIDIRKFDRVRLARKVPTEGSPVLQCKLTSFSRTDASAVLATISGKPAETFTAESFVAHAVPVMNAIVNEGFFGDVVVVVEGLTEVGILWSIQNILKKNWDALGIVVVPADGKSKIDRPVVVFRGLGIPAYFLFDADVKHKGNKPEKSTTEANARYLRLAGVDVSDFPPTFVGSDWAVFKDDIEDEIQVAIGKEYFLHVREAVATDFGYAKPSDALKNPEVAAALIRMIYADDKTIPVLEDIVEKITALRLG